MPQPTFTTFIFDLDGTILDTLPDLVVLTNTALENAGYPPRTREEILSYVGNGARALMLQAVPEGAGEEAAERALESWKSLYLSYDNDLTRPFPQVEETLAELRLRGARLGVLSNKFDPGVRQIIDQCLPGCFDVMHGECDGYPRKPDPTGLLKTIAELGAEVSDCVYVGDSPSDIQAARNAGVFAIGVGWGYHQESELRAALPDAMLGEFSNLIRFAQ